MLARAVQAGLAEDATPGQQRAGHRATRRMILANQRLVISACKKYESLCIGSKGRIEMADLIQEGTIGLHRAVRKFDPARGFKFSTYAFWWIRQGAERYIQLHALALHIPPGAQLDVRRINRGRADLVTRNSALLADARAAMYSTSLDAPMRSTSDDGDGSVLGDTIADPKNGPSLLTEELRAGLKQLSEADPDAWALVELRDEHGPEGIAELLDITPVAAGNRVRNARVRLAKTAGRLGLHQLIAG